MRRRRDHRLQLGDDALGLVEPALHLSLVRGEHLARHVGIAGVDHGAHLLEREVEGAQPLHDGGVGELVDGVAAVPGLRVDRAGTRIPDSW